MINVPFAVKRSFRSCFVVVHVLHPRPAIFHVRSRHGKSNTRFPFVVDNCPEAKFIERTHCARTWIIFHFCAKYVESFQKKERERKEWEKKNRNVKLGEPYIIEAMKKQTRALRHSSSTPVKMAVLIFNRPVESIAGSFSFFFF